MAERKKLSDKELYTILNMSTKQIKQKNVKQLLSLVRKLQGHASKLKDEEQEKIKEKNLPKPNIYRDYDKENKGRLVFQLNTKKRLVKDKRQVRGYLISEFYRTKQFLTSETSTISGWEDTIRRFADTIKRRTKVDVNIEELSKNKTLYNRLFKTYILLTEASTEWKNLDSAQAFKTISETVLNNRTKTPAQLVNKLLKKAENVYRESKEKERNKLLIDSLDMSNDEIPNEFPKV